MLHLAANTRQHTSPTVSRFCISWAASAERQARDRIQECPKLATQHKTVQRERGREAFAHVLLVLNAAAIQQRQCKEIDICGISIPDKDGDNQNRVDQVCSFVPSSLYIYNCLGKGGRIS